MEQLELPPQPSPEVSADEQAQDVARTAQHLAERIQVVKLSSAEEDPALAEGIARFSFREFEGNPEPSPTRVARRVKSLSDKTAVAALDSTGKIRAIGIESIDYRKGTAEIQEVVTAEDSRGMGLGGNVVTALETEAKDYGIKSVSLYPVDERAQQFYSRLGYQPTDTEDYTKAI